MKFTAFILLILICFSCRYEVSVDFQESLNDYDKEATKFISENLNTGESTTKSISIHPLNRENITHYIESFNAFYLIRQTSKQELAKLRDKYKNQILCSYESIEKAAVIDSCLSPIKNDKSVFKALNYSANDNFAYIEKINTDLLFQDCHYPIPKFLFNRKVEHVIITGAGNGKFLKDYELTGIKKFPDTWNNGYLTGYAYNKNNDLILWLAVW